MDLKDVASLVTKQSVNSKKNCSAENFPTLHIQIRRTLIDSFWQRQ